MVKLHVQRATLLQECQELVKERDDIAQELASGSGSGAAGQVEVAKRRLAAITLQIQRVQEEVTIVSEAAMKEGLTKCVRGAATYKLALLAGCKGVLFSQSHTHHPCKTGLRGGAPLLV